MRGEGIFLILPPEAMPDDLDKPGAWEGMVILELPWTPAFGSHVSQVRSVMPLEGGGAIVELGEVPDPPKRGPRELVESWRRGLPAGSIDHTEGR